MSDTSMAARNFDFDYSMPVLADLFVSVAFGKYRYGRVTVQLQAAHNMAENSSSSASTSATPTNAPATDTAGATDVIGVLGALLKNQTGESISNERVAQLVLANMATLVKQGKLTQQQILQVLPESMITAREG